MIWCGSGSTREVWTRQERIEEVGQADAMGLGDQAEERAVAVEAPRAACRQDFQRRLAVAEQDFGADPARAVFIHDLQHVRAVPFDADKLDGGIGSDAFDERACREVFQRNHSKKVIIPLSAKQ